VRKKIIHQCIYYQNRPKIGHPPCWEFHRDLTQTVNELFRGSKPIIGPVQALDKKNHSDAHGDYLFMFFFLSDLL
jgi:hypothetical protein